MPRFLPGDRLRLSYVVREGTAGIAKIQLPAVGSSLPVPPANQGKQRWTACLPGQRRQEIGLDRTCLYTAKSEPQHQNPRPGPGPASGCLSNRSEYANVSKSY